MVTIKIHLLNSRTTATTYNDVSIESPNNYRIIEGEKNTTQFELVYDQNVWNDYTFKVEMVNSKGYSVEPPTITNNTFTLPNGMATAGYGYIGIKAEKGNEVVTFMPVKVKVWDYVEAWKGNVIDRNITFQEFVDLENRVEDLEQNGTGGGSVANAVTTDTEQTITGAKTFEQPLFVKEASYTDPAGKDGVEIQPHAIVHYDTYVQGEDGFKQELTFPEEGGVVATQQFVQDYVAENGGGGSSADVGEMQFCGYRDYPLDYHYSVGTSYKFSIGLLNGTPVVGQYVRFANGIGLVTEIAEVGNTYTVNIVSINKIALNGSYSFNTGTMFFAPISAGNSGEVLTSTGKSGEPPVWLPPTGGSSGNVNIFYVQEIEDGNSSFDEGEIIFTLFGNATESEFDWSVSGAAGIGYALTNYAGYNGKVQATGTWNGEVVWAVSGYGGWFTVYTTSGSYQVSNYVTYTRKTYPLNKNFTIGE